MKCIRCKAKVETVPFRIRFAIAMSLLFGMNDHTYCKPCGKEREDLGDDEGIAISL